MRKLNYQEAIFFEALTKDRIESAMMLEKPSMRGIKNSVVEKYSDQAHFIYELLQNADDAKATKARFILESNRLIFAHNGSRHFSVTDPQKEEEDSLSGNLGDINAITAIANSNKTEASIGKFGVGFKAVFQYTSTPHIYDPNFCFKISRFIVPILLEKDFPGRRSEETLFVFPFDHPERSEDEAYQDIADKLRNLSFPLLFLTNLKDIVFEFGNQLGLYGKTVKKTYTFGNTTAEQICLTQNKGEEVYDENIWLFSRLDDYQRKYSIGFFLDDTGHLKPIREPAFCFFPTKEVTGLQFIIHAPFLLTDSREGIRAGVPHNDRMLQKLAELSADAIEYLRDMEYTESIRFVDDTILSIIPIAPKDFSDPEDKRKVSFLPFYGKIRQKFQTSELLPSSDGYVAPQNAYWAAMTQLPQLFSNEQLADITDNKDAKWVFLTLGRDDVQRTYKDLFIYIDTLVKTNLNEDAIIGGRSKGLSYNHIFGKRMPVENIKGITAEFIEKQSIEWLYEFYKWVSDSKHRTEISVKRPVFLNQYRKAVPAFDSDNQLILFLPVKDIEGFMVVHPELLQNADTLQFIEDIGIKQPSLKDQIYNIILPKYQDNHGFDTDPHFLIFFDYYCKCPNTEVDDFIDLIRSCEFLTCYDQDGNRCNKQPDAMYWPSKGLKAFFETKQEIYFLDVEKYQNLVGLENKKQLESFLNELGVRREISIITRQIDGNLSDRKDLPHPRSTKKITWTETILEGLKEIVECILQNHDKEKSVVLWNNLLEVIACKCNSWNTLGNLLKGTVRYYYYSKQSKEFLSSDTLLLRDSAWMVDIYGNFVKPRDLFQNTISEKYNITSEYAEQLMDFLGIHKENFLQKVEEENNLTDEQRKKIALAEKLKEFGIEDISDLEEFKEYRRKKEEKKQKAEVIRREDKAERISIAGDFLFESSGVREYIIEEGFIKKEKRDVIRDIARRTRERTVINDFVNVTEEDMDADEYMPAAVDYSKKIENAKQKSAAEIDKITYFESLQNKALQSEKYSYGWFTALLEMESLNSGEAESASRKVSISFGKVEREPGTKRTLVLRYPNRYIPQFMEDLSDIPLVLHFGEQTKNLVIEAANIKSYTLRVKIRNSEDLENIDLSKVTSATIDTKSPIFLLEELRKQFAELGYTDDFHMQKNLCENISFVFGPPGTGKTTYLAKDVLLPMMEQNTSCRVLVLTPTNKSADVLVRRIMQICGENHSYENWLVRFGATADEEIEESPVFREKTFDIRALSKSVTVTTIARFPYDFFMPQGTRLFLNNMSWDYIVIDEASMIPLANIILPLYKKTPKKFIIAGDPFQIEPITSVDLWKNENIYTMVHLDSFKNPKTVPYPYNIKMLTTQYRSVPAIGDIFSKLAYDGILQHSRSEDSQRALHIDDLGVETLNIIKFPVSKYESIYRCKRLQHSSSYQVYSTLFTFEYICFMAKKIAQNNPGQAFKIGVIAPYRAQADLIEKLLASERLPREIDVQVGTIHSFQGDESDIIFAVFNTPPAISTSKNMFLNNRNIINVSISRARDYLFIVMPDDETDNIAYLKQVKHVESLVQESDSWNEFLSPDLEDLMFGDPKYLENNVFSTSHQSVNVYGLPEKCYEVRTEDTAVDIQIHKRKL